MADGVLKRGAGGDVDAAAGSAGGAAVRSGRIGSVGMQVTEEMILDIMVCK